jgi:hypothetical protein
MPCVPQFLVGCEGTFRDNTTINFSDAGIDGVHGALYTAAYPLTRSEHIDENELVDEKHRCKPGLYRADTQGRTSSLSTTFIGLTTRIHHKTPL